MSYLIVGRTGHFMLVSTLVVTGFTLGDLGSSEAQGPLRRLGDRIRARVDTNGMPAHDRFSGERSVGGTVEHVIREVLQHISLGHEADQMGPTLVVLHHDRRVGYFVLG